MIHIGVVQQLLASQLILFYQDGVLNENEVQHWVMPDDYDHAIAESQHLIHESDTDKVGITI